MERILEEIGELKALQKATNNLVIENGKRDEMILLLLREILREANAPEGSDDVSHALKQVIRRLDSIVRLLSERTDGRSL